MGTEEKKQTRRTEIRARLNCLRSAVTAILCTNRALVYYTPCVRLYIYIIYMYNVYFTILHGRRAYIKYLFTRGLDLTWDTFYIRTVIILYSPYYSSDVIIGDCFSFLTIPSSTVYWFISISVQRNHWSFYIKCSVLVFTTNRHRPRRLRLDEDHCSHIRETLPSAVAGRMSPRW